MMVKNHGLPAASGGLSWETDPTGHDGLGIELPRPPGVVAGRHRLSRHGLEELALQELMGGRGRGGM
ncbi:unnamed protein product [Ectocarpus sp. CCAP 1310/34]|nr:unnamed protein product [Ectocarpus sp. CCAP 1310/34]